MVVRRFCESTSGLDQVDAELPAIRRGVQTVRNKAVHADQSGHGRSGSVRVKRGVEEDVAERVALHRVDVRVHPLVEPRGEALLEGVRGGSCAKVASATRWSNATVIWRWERCGNVLCRERDPKEDGFQDGRRPGESSVTRV